METYELNLCGLKRDLPICEVNEHLSLAGFIMFGDVEITVAAAEGLLKKAPEFDILLTAESKGIPIAYEMARQSGKSYVVTRKMAKLYMHDPIAVEVKSISTAVKQTLWLDQSDIDKLKGKRILIVDDVISTGGSLAALESLAEQAGGIIAGKCAVLAEGEAADRDDIFYLEYLPVFEK